jgi:hypothetical protein
MIGSVEMRLGDGIRRAGLLGLALGAGLTAAGCADLARVTSLAPEGVDTASPVAQRVREASAADYPRPRFRDIPPAPMDVRPVGAWRSAVDQTVQAGNAVTAWVAANPTSLTGDTETFAAGQRASIPASEREAAPPDPAGTEDFAARLRAMAAPPPPPN